MKSPAAYSLLLSLSALSLSASASLAQQQVTGTLGAPRANSTFDGQSLPAAPPPFGGTINLDAQDATAWWPPTVVPPSGAPNVLLIMTDDAGYGVSGTFAGVIPTPTLDQIAADGLRFTQFHSTALCSTTAPPPKGPPSRLPSTSLRSRPSTCRSPTS